MLSQKYFVPRAISNKQKLLLIDDDPSVISSLRFVLGGSYDVSSAATIREGLRIFEELRPPLVILDLRLPDGNGVDALREIRRMDPHAAVVILTAYSTRMAAEESLRLGAIDYVNKPFTVDDFRERIDRLAKSVAARPAEAGAPAGEPPEPMDIQTASAAFLHDVAGPLSSLMVTSDLLKHRLTSEQSFDRDEIGELAAMMTDNVRYMSALLEQWRTFSALDISLRDKCLVQKAIDLAVRQIMAMEQESKVVFQMKAPRGEFNVPGNHFALARVLINLLKNAYEAAPANGRGRVSLSMTAAKQVLRLVISDNGPGIEEEQLPKIFLPHYTTKEGGRGLGLFICKKIVEAVGGQIAVRVPGEMTGTDFIVTLPLV
jgi:signal transduction histidine kinase